MSLRKVDSRLSVRDPKNDGEVDQSIPLNEPEESTTKGAVPFSDFDYAHARVVLAGIDFVELTDYPFDRSVISLVPATMCRRYQILPLRMNNGRLVLAMADPGDVIAIDEVSGATGLQIEPVGVSKNDLRIAFDRFLRADD